MAEQTEAARGVLKRGAQLVVSGAVLAGNQGQSPIRASILAGDVKARHDKMVEFTRRVMSDKR